MFYRWMLIAVASGICVIYGFRASNKLKKREESLNDFIYFFSALKNEMSYSRRDIEEALKWLMPSVNKHMEIFISNVINELRTQNMSIKSAFMSSIEACKNSGALFFEHEDELIILNAAVMLGTSDYEGQAQVIENTIEQLKIKMYTAKDISNKKGQLYKKLGMFACAAIIIIFI